MMLRLSELEESSKESRKIRAEGLGEYEEIDRVLQHQELPLVLEVIRTKLIIRHYNNSLVRYFDINKTKKLIGQKYYWLSLRKDVDAYVKGCNICLGSKAVRHKSYGNLQFLPI